ncbi:hypothetical protein KI688_010220 [Linnemannia hyalina]|uniref:Galactose oxidase n=1 Tax=Linnemannia hyalina TaxID=64524 RepID=A0A9P7XXY1_9FUNG|nr:hypothetical protein KI688_010220 [Linnemannia hyalina]
MKSSISIMMAIAVCASSSSMLVNAQSIKPTAGHSATLLDSTVFIQGGLGADGNPTNAAYSLRLGQDGAYTGSTLLDITQLAGFSARGFHSSVESSQGLMINCGGFDAAGATTHKMSCDIFNSIKYTSTKMNMTVPNVSSRGGMAVSIDPTSTMAYHFGGSLTSAIGADGGFSNEVDMLKLDSAMGWRSGTAMPAATRYHTATWIDSLKSFVILGGQIQAGTAVAMNVASTFSGVTWGTRPIAGDAVSARFGHTAVEDGQGNIYIYGGQTAAGTVPLSDIYLLNTTAATWAWKKINVPAAEPRAFHASVLLNDSSILHTFGQAGAGPESAVSTFSFFNTLTNTWITAANPPAVTVATESPNKGTGISNNPNDPNFQHPGNDSGEEGKSGKGAAIGGAIGGVAAVLILVAGFIFYRRRQSNRHSSGGSIAAGPYSKHSASASGQIGGAGRSSLNLQDGDKSKLGRSFTIRQPAPAYVDDNSVQDLKHARPYDDGGYNNKHNDRSAGGYGGEPAVIEYELTDTSGHRYEPGSVAERKRYVEEQQRQLMSGFESVYPDQPLPFHHQQFQTSNNNQQQQQDDFYGSPTLTAVSSPRGEAAKVGGRSPSQSRRNRSQSRSEQGANNGAHTAQSPTVRAQQAQRPYENYPDHSEFSNDKF